MAEQLCGQTPPVLITPDSELLVVDKYKELMTASLEDGSIYERTKSTYYELFKDLELDAEEKAKMIAETMSGLTTQLSMSAMQTALGWAKEERDGELTLKLLQAQSEKALYDIQVSKAQVCDVEAGTRLKQAQIQATLSQSIRDNGRPSEWKADEEYWVTQLHDENLKYEQTVLVEGQTYSTLAASFRKDGIVEIDTNGKPIGGDENGKMVEDIKFSQRQRISFEDSKRNHAANAASQMISGLLAAEINIGDHSDLVERWERAMDYLNSDSTCPNDVLPCD